MIVVAGEALVDLIERRDSAKTTETPANPVYDAFLGGGPFNAALALGTLDREVGYLFPLSSDRYGSELADRLTAAGVVPLLPERSSYLTPLALVGLDAAGKASYRFYRTGTADRDFTLERLLRHLPSRPDAVITGTLAIAEDDDPLILKALLNEAKDRGAVTVVDPNMRPEAYTDLAGYVTTVLAVMRDADIVKASDDDIAVLFPGVEPEEALQRLVTHHGVKVAVMTRGPAGAVGFTQSFRAEVSAYVPPHFGDTVGAGDCFLGGLIDRLVPAGSNGSLDLNNLDDQELTNALRQAVAVAGLNCAVSGCHPPARQEVETVLAGA